jgi:integrase/recombinase XerD
MSISMMERRPEGPAAADQHLAQMWFRAPRDWDEFLTDKARQERCSRSELLRRAFMLTYSAELEQHTIAKGRHDSGYSDAVGSPGVGPPGDNHPPSSHQEGDDPWLEAITDFVHNKRSPQTRRSYRLILREFLGFTGKHPAEEHQGDVIGYRRHLEMLNRSPSTIVQHLACISGYYDLCARRGLTRDNPATGVERPHVEAYTGATWLNGEQARLFLAQPDRSAVKGKRDYAILVTIIVTGMRRAELCSLKRQHISHRAGQTCLSYIGKGGVGVVRSITARCWDAIQDYLIASGRHLTDDSPVFTALTSTDRAGQTESPLSPEAVRQIVAGYARKAFGDAVRVSPHTLRHTAATLLRQSGRALEEVQGFLRHRRIETTRQYLHTVEASDSELGECIWGELTG